MAQVAGSMKVWNVSPPRCGFSCARLLMQTWMNSCPGGRAASLPRVPLLSRTRRANLGLVRVPVCGILRCMLRGLLMLWIAYLLIGGAMVGWGDGWVEIMGVVYLVSIPISGTLCRILQSEDLVWCSYTAYGIGLVGAFIKGSLALSSFPSLPAMVAAVVGGALFAIALPVGVLLLMIPSDREEP